jgi:hypothetical protein
MNSEQGQGEVVQSQNKHCKKNIRRKSCKKRSQNYIQKIGSTAQGRVSPMVREKDVIPDRLISC